LCVHRPTSLHCGDKFTILLASAPVASDATTVDPVQDLILDTTQPPAVKDFTPVLFADVAEFIKESIPTTGAEPQPTDKLNMQTVDASHLVRTVLLLMAATGLQLSGESGKCCDFSELAVKFTAWAQKSPSRESAVATASELRGLDREYAVECADSTFTNIHAILDRLLPGYLDGVAGLANTAAGTLTGAVSVASLESSMEDFAKVGVDGGGGSLAGAHSSNNQNASFGSASIVDDYSQVEAHEERRLVEHFEAIFCALVVFACNVEVLAERCAALRVALREAGSSHDDTTSLRLKDWRNIQRELRRVVPIDWNKVMQSGQANASADEQKNAGDYLVGHDGAAYEDDEEEDDGRGVAEADGDAEYSLGSVESEERRMLQNIVRQHQLHDYAQQSGADLHQRYHQQQRQQQDQHSDEGDHRDYHDERSSLGGEGDHDFGADSGDDSFFSGSRSRRVGETDSYDQDDELAQTRDFELSFASHEGQQLSLRATAPAYGNPAVAAAGPTMGPVPASARGRPFPDAGATHAPVVENTYTHHGDREFDRDRVTPGASVSGSRPASPALSFDSLSHPAVRGREAHDSAQQSLYDGEEPYLSDGSSSVDSRLGGRSHHSRRGDGQHDGGSGEDSDMERYYQEQAQEMENMDLQRAIAASMHSGGTSQHGFEGGFGRRHGALAFDGQPGRFGEGVGLAVPESAPAVPRIRDQVNTLASKCYLAIESLCGATETSGASASPLKGRAEATGVSGGSENMSVHSLYLLWEASQVVTQTGFEVLYTAEEQATVFAQLIRSPSSFMYIIPGIVQGASRFGRFEACFANLMPSKEALFTSSLDAPQPGSGDDAQALDLNAILSFLGFCNAYIRDCRDVLVPSATAALSTATTPSRRQLLASAADAVSVRMFRSVTRALVVLAKHLLSELFNRIDACESFLNDTIGLAPTQPLGGMVARVLDALVDCVQSDLEVLTKKVTVFDTHPEGRFHNSFLASMVKFVYAKCMARFDVVRANALLPHSIRLVRLFQSHYDAYKRRADSRDKFNAWLVTTLRWPIYHIAGTFSLLLQPPSSVQPPRLRQSFLLCKALLSEGDVRQRMAAVATMGVGSGAVYSWEQQVWAAIGRTELNINSRTSSALAEISDAHSVPRTAEQGVDPALLLLTGVCVERWHLLDTMRALEIFPPVSPTSGAHFDLQKFLSAPSIDSYKQKMKAGDVFAWNNLPAIVQLMASLLHTWCYSTKIDVAALATHLEPLIVGRQTKQERCSADLSSLVGNAAFVALLNLVFQTVLTTVALIEGVAQSVQTANKGLALRNAVSQSKELLFSGYRIVVPPPLLPANVLSEALNRPTVEEGVTFLAQRLRAADVAAMHAQMIELVGACNSLLHPGVSSELVLARSRPGYQHAAKAAQSPNAALLTFLVSGGLRLSRVAQACLWDIDAVKNQQFAMSLLSLTVETLQASPEAMHCCAEFLHSFMDPLGGLEEISYRLLHNAGDASQPTTMAASLMSATHRTEQLLSKLDASVTSRISGLPTSVVAIRDAAEPTLEAFGKPSLKQVSDLLELLRHSTVAQSLFNESALVASSLPLPAAPFSTALKKVGEAMTALLAARKPEDHGALTLEDVLGANRQLTLLQAALCGLTTLHQIEKAEMTSAVATGKKPAPDRSHEKSAFLHALCSTLTPLCSLVKCLLSSFQQHLLFCQGVQAQYLFPAVKAIEHSSPTVLYNVFAPQGSYCLGFWLYVPELVKLVPDIESGTAKPPPKRLHLVSRIFESGEMNLVALLSSDAADSANFSLSVVLVIHPGEAPGAPATAVLEVTVAATDFTSATRETINTSANARAKAVRKATVCSKPLATAEWTSCVVELVQDSVKLPPDSKTSAVVGAAARAQARREHKTKYNDSTSVALIVNNALHATCSLQGGRSAHHQNMVIGKIPKDLGVSVSDKNRLVLTDVFWVPTSLYLASAVSQDRQHPVLAAMGATHLINAADSTQSAATEQPRYYENVLPHCPPSLLLEALDSACKCSARILDLVAAHLGVPSTTGAVLSTVQGTEQAVPANLLPIICTFATELLCLGDPSSQDSAIKALAAIVQSLPVATTSASDSSSADASKSAKMLSPASPAGSAFNAAIQNKAVLASKSALAFCFGLVEDILQGRASTETELTSEVLKRSPCQSASLGVRDIWLRRLHLGRSNVERCLRVTDWGAKLTVDENVLLSGTTCLLNAAVRKGIVSAEYPSEYATFAGLLCAGGWAPAAYVGRTARLCPRKLFLHYDSRATEQCAFPTVGAVVAGGLNRPGVSLIHCDGAYQRVDRLNHCNPLLPRGLRGTTQSTEMVAALDHFSPLRTADVEPLLSAFPLKSASEIIDMLRKIVDAPAASASKTAAPPPVTSPARGPKTPQSKSLLSQFESTLSAVAEDAGGRMGRSVSKLAVPGWIKCTSI
jgi:hypothetical protein